MRARHQNIRSPAPEPVQPYRSDCPCRRVGTLPKPCQIDACTVHDRRAQATPVPPTRRAMRLSGIDFAAPGRCREKTALDRLRRFDHARFNPRLPGGKATPHRRYAPEAAQNAPEAARSPQRARSRADASQKPAPRARPSAGRVWWRAHRRTFTPTDTIRAGASRQTPPRTRQKPAEAQNAPGAGQKPAPRARRPLRVWWRAPRPAYQPAPALRARRRPERARSQPQAPTARYFASARSPTRSGFDCDARALRNCNSTRPSCARRRRRSASVIGCGRPARSHRMHSSFVRVGFSFLLHVHAGRYGCSASGFHSLTSSRSRNRSSSVRE